MLYNLNNKQYANKHRQKTIIQKSGSRKTRDCIKQAILQLNSTAIEMIKKLREEFYFVEDSPLVCHENGNYTKPSNFRKRFYKILDGAKIEKKGFTQSVPHLRNKSCKRNKTA